MFAACAGEISLDNRDLATEADLQGQDQDLAGADLAGADLARTDLGAADLSTTGIGGAGTPLPAGDQTLSITVGGQPRSVILHVPPGAGPMPLVVALHGNGDSAANFVAVRGLKARADAGPFVLAAPQGVASVPSGVPQSVDWDAYTAPAGNADIQLLDAIKAQVGASSTVDQKRTFVWGYSQGGYMSMRWGMERSATLSCTGVMAAASPTGSALITGAARKIAVAMQIGDQDFGISAARSTKTTLENNGNPLQYNEIAGAGHVPFPGDPQVSLDYCLGQSLP